MLFLMLFLKVVELIVYMVELHRDVMIQYAILEGCGADSVHGRTP